MTGAEVQQVVTTAGVMAGAFVAIAAATRLPHVRSVFAYLWRGLAGPLVDAYWDRHRDVAREAIEPQLLPMAMEVATLDRYVQEVARELEGVRLQGVLTEGKVDQAVADLSVVQEKVGRIIGHLGLDRRLGDRPDAPEPG